jgi:hypothetical protein
MSYNFKRALGIGLALYVSTFIVGIISGMISGFDPSTSLSDMPDSFWYIGMIAAVILTALFTKWYFKSPSIVPSAKNGFWFGLTAIILSSLMDMILFSIGGASNELGGYFGDYRFWIIVGLVLVTAKLVGHMKKIKKLHPIGGVF